MEEFLKLTIPYEIDPQGGIFAILGTITHGSMEEQANKLELPAEIALSEDRNVFDLLEPGDDGSWILTDYKTWGSFRVAKALGMQKTRRVPDSSGEVYKKSGPWGGAGSPKMVDVWERTGIPDLWETEMQLNNYRVMLDDMGIIICRMQLQIFVRDGGTSSADSRGVTQNFIPLIPIRPIDDEEVRGYFDNKEADLYQALEQEFWAIPCDDRESWSGTKCRDYCRVWQGCPKGRLLKGAS
jgi:hypothetical protein